MQNDFFDSISVDDITRAVSSLKEYLYSQGKEVCEEIYSTGKLEEPTEQKLRSSLEDWKRTFPELISFIFDNGFIQGHSKSN